MKAARVHQWGPPEIIVLETVEVSSPGEGEILVRVHAAGVGPWDALVRSGNSGLPQTLPLTLGSDGRANRSGDDRFRGRRRSLRRHQSDVRGRLRRICGR
jgi:NADPH:quinone reductase-like Zn-dependent oxidoreductase